MRVSDSRLGKTSIETLKYILEQSSKTYNVSTKKSKTDSWKRRTI